MTQPPPEDGAEGIQWLLDHVIVRSQRTNVRANVYLHSLEAAHAVSHIIEEVAGVSAHIYTKDNRHTVSFGPDFVRWMETIAPMPECPVAYYHWSLKTAWLRAGEFARKIESERNRLIDMLERKHGKRGCFHCGLSATECHLEFDHIDHSHKTGHVSALLGYGQWAKAEVEALKCRLLCMTCHRLKTAINKEITGKRRLPQSADPVVEKKRERARGNNKKRAEYGTARLAKAKLDAKYCAMCGRAVDSTNLHCFDFDHTDISSKKKLMSSLRMASDFTFYEELKGCRLLCVDPCHLQVTKQQRASGLIQAKALATFKRNRALQVEPAVKAQRTSVESD